MGTQKTSREIRKLQANGKNEAKMEKSEKTKTLQKLTKLRFEGLHPFKSYIFYPTEKMQFLILI